MDTETLPDRVAEDRPEWTTRFARGDVLARAGAWAEALYVVRRGRVGLWLPSDGPDTPSRVVGPDEAIGLAAVLTGATYGSTAEALEPTHALRIPADAIAELSAAAPGLLVQLTVGLARELQAALQQAALQPAVRAGTGTSPVLSTGTAPADAAAPVPINAGAVAPSLAPAAAATAVAAEPPAQDAPALRPLYLEEVICPVCETAFQATRVRVRALSAIRRETDLYTVYAGLSPLHYAADVCPSCAYAGYPDDWSDCDARLRATLEADRAERLQAAGGFRFAGERTPQAGLVSILLALRCYELRGIDARRRATILHRLAWISREIGDAEQEASYLAAARHAYEMAYREGASPNDPATVRVPYLLGELAFRLGDPREAIRWFERTVRAQGIDEHPDLQRLAHDRWIDARESMRQSG